MCRRPGNGGDYGISSLAWHDGRRICVGYVGEEGIEPNVAYKCVDGKLVKAL